MELLPVTFQCLVLLACVVLSAEGKVFCFRRVKKKGKCGGHLKKLDYATPEECCQGRGVGFATKKQKIGRNRFICTPCSDIGLGSENTLPLPKKNNPDRKKNRKRNKTTEAPTTTTTTTTTATTSPDDDVVYLMTTTSRPGHHDRGHDFEEVIFGKKDEDEEVEDEEEEKDERERVRVRVEEREESRNAEVVEWPRPHTDGPNRFGYVAFPRYDDDDDVVKIQWSEWSPCSATCGAGWRSRFKICDGCDKNDYENVMSRPCMIKFYCPVDGNWGPWFPWQPCSQSCNGGTRIRQRKCNYPPPAYGGDICEGDATASDECNERLCPVDGAWSEWSEFTLCSVTCGSGVKRRVRACDNPSPANGGRECSGQNIGSSKCEVGKCPQDGGWTEWGDWSQCAATCESGLRTRTRECGNPRPRFGGSECQGEATETAVCESSRPCPVDGGWSTWNDYGGCRAHRCEWGFRIRTRLCSDPPPQHGGARCEGNQYERVECFNDQDCPRNGTWCEWSDWSACSGSCAEHTSLQVRHRTCTCPEPRFGGGDCEGDSLQVKECVNLPYCNPEVAEGLGTGEESKGSKCGEETEGSGADGDCDQDEERRPGVHE